MREERMSESQCACTLTQENKDGSQPLQRCNDVPKQQHRAQDGKELPCCRDDGAGEGPEIHNSHKDEGLKQHKEEVTTTETI